MLLRFALVRADAKRVLGVQTDFAVLIDDLRVQRENHVLFQFDLALRADRRVLDHGGADGMSRQMAQRKAAACKGVGGEQHQQTSQESTPSRISLRAASIASG